MASIDPRYPIGRFHHDGPASDDQLTSWIADIEALPQKMRRAVGALTNDQLDTPYREGGWTARQVVHHVGDSHLNSYVRFKWALTEEEPVVKAYDEKAWAETADVSVVSVDDKLNFLAALHVRWTALLRTLSREQLVRRWVHPDSGPKELAWTIGMYAWHGRHHLAHIELVGTTHAAPSMGEGRS